MQTFKEFLEEQQQLDELFNKKKLKLAGQDIKNTSRSVADKVFVINHVIKLWDTNKLDRLGMQVHRERNLTRDELRLAQAMQKYIDTSTTLGFIKIDKVEAEILRLMGV